LAIVSEMTKISYRIKKSLQISFGNKVIDVLFPQPRTCCYHVFGAIGMVFLRKWLRN
jgi:hypothetical protein